MSKTDFTRTSAQIERHVLDLIDSIDRSLESSTGDSERKGQLVLGAVLSVVVFFTILCFDFFTSSDPKNADKAAPSPANQLVLHERDLDGIRVNLERISSHTKAIADTKTRIAPSMTIDGNIDSINNSVADINRSLKIAPEQ